MPHAESVWARSTRVQIVDETYVDASPTLVAAVLTHPYNVANAWPHLRTRLIAQRGDEGAIWEVDGHLRGEIEVWIEPCWDGAIVHHYVRAEAAAGRAAAVEKAHVRRWKNAITAIKDRLEPPRNTWSFDGGASIRSRTPSASTS
ncbi:hypothetical protein KEM60_02314 [Austwickia sp. TVS 96-490-7B]|uniref:hypothetical protein n=1 Tax=Austwickia sp. TVS 96-490-7B TaxID=2830843 RepID=UPI001C59AF89|nr:hypothetical protein [Austwickia sp. TVS 96-490-7B]MBW3086103.1 hypothetical protein [Austwickia sp. TVS 96-490-7B]